MRFTSIAARLAAAALLFGALAACQRDQPSPIRVDLGPGGERAFVPTTALAESLVLPGDHNELRIILAEGEASCDRYVPPDGGELRLTVTIFAPDGVPIGPGAYPWSQPPPMDGQDDAPMPLHAVPKVHYGNESHLLRPGGGIQLTRVDPGPGGTVEGVLGFEFPGDGKSPATRVRGRFSARICQPGGRNAD